MKLRNKKTGEINYGDLHLDNFESLAELNAEWEDYEDYWYIDCDGEVYSTDRLNGFDLDRMLNIGNRFNSREEAEKAVEKLKVWKRLKDKGISLHLQKQFRGDGIGYSRTIYTDFTKDSQEIVKDLDLLFGGEE